MDENNSLLFPTPLIRDRWHRAFKRLAVYAVLLVIGFMLLHRAINPTDRNHLVVIRLDDQEYGDTFTAKLIGDFDWEQPVSIGGERPGAQDLSVTNISSAWGSGHFTITDDRGTVAVDVDIEPRGRYCGALVILIDERGKAHTGWNEMPDPGQ